MKELEILVNLFCVYLVETLGATCAPRDNFLRNNESWTKQIMHLKWALANLQNKKIYCPSGKYKLLIRSFLEDYCYKMLLLWVCYKDIIATLKKIFGSWHKCDQNLFSPEFDNNFYQVFHLYNNATFIVFQWNIISPLNFFF